MAFADQVAGRRGGDRPPPDILVHGCNEMRLTLSTNSEGGWTDADHAPARRIGGLLPG